MIVFMCSIHQFTYNEFINAAISEIIILTITLFLQCKYGTCYGGTDFMRKKTIFLNNLGDGSNTVQSV